MTMLTTLDGDTPLPPVRHARFGIGEVVRHRLLGFRGVIFDVDPVFANSEEWYQSIPQEVRPPKDQPFYHLLAENAEANYIAYVSQQNIERDEADGPVDHPGIAGLFDPFDGERYPLRRELSHLAIAPRPARTYEERMAQLDTREKLAILADAAKYDASCASSGTAKRNSRDGKGLGSTEGMGICHAYAPDGRCISLLKILLTNSCIFDCHYCINRKSSNVRRARFTVEEVVKLTLAFYRRNYIEGLFLSSGIIRSSDYTMEMLVEVARSLRVDHGFRGYIHLKTIPDADPELVHQAGLHADRLSINVELPTERGLKRLAPEKDGARIAGAMGGLKLAIEDGKDARKRYRSAPIFAPAGQSTQMIVGADSANDGEIIASASSLYDRFGLRRVYYSAFSPIPDASTILPLKRPPLMREHRLYQSDWLMRFYGFSAQEVAAAANADGMLPLDIDPKLAWALKFRDIFPVDVNHAPKRDLLRVPGLGLKAIDALLAARRWRRLRLEDVGRLTVSVAKVRPFIRAEGWSPAAIDGAADLARLVKPQPKQGELFAA